jgi:predicted GNAT family N-acyltransferase
MSDIQVIKITTPEQQAEAFKIRQEVFVEEQKVSPEDEYDQYESSSTHFLVYCEGQPCATARWRFTEKGIKLERFAVRKAYRGKKAGEAVLKAVLDDIAQDPQSQGKLRYLHAQVQVVPFYAKQGFVPEGEMFEECAIQHYKMVQK